jgi:acetyl esterase/lipase
LIVYIGGDENTKVGVAGDSAGALIAASLCHMIKKLDFQVEIVSSPSIISHFDKQILVYGGFDFAGQTESHKEFTRPEHVLTRKLLAW